MDASNRGQDRHQRIVRGLPRRMAAVVALLAVVSSACATGVTTPTSTPSMSTAPATATADATTSASPEAITLTYWDADGLYLAPDKIVALDRQFEAANPGVTVVRVSKAFNDVMATERLAASDPNPPDILLMNYGFTLMGPFVEAGLLLPLDDYAAKYGWNERFSKALLDRGRFTPDGKSFGTGTLFSVAPSATYMAVYYNREKLAALGLEVPSTYTEFTAALQAAKDSGEVPMIQGTQEQWPAINLVSLIQGAVVDKQFLRDWMLRGSGASVTFEDPRNVKAGTEVQDLAKAGLVSDGFAGTTVQSALDDFAAGTGVFFPQGTWFSSTINEKMGDKAGIFLLRSDGDVPLAVTGGPGLGMSISAGSKHPDVAAAYLDFRTSRAADEVLAAAGGLPAAPFEYTGPSLFIKEVFDAWRVANDEDALVPFIDHAAPGMFDTAAASSQELVALQVTPEQWAAAIQAKYEEGAP